MKEPRLAASSPTSRCAPPFEGGAAHATNLRPRSFWLYNLYTKINAFFFEYPQQDRIVQNLTFLSFWFFFFPLTRNPFTFLFLYLYKICRSARSTRVDCFTDRLVRLTSFSSSFFFLVLFSKCTANHPPLTYFALTLTEFQDHAGLPGETRLAYFTTVGRWSFLALYAGVLSIWAIIFKKILYFAIFLIPIKKNEPPAVKKIGHRGRDRSFPTRPCGTISRITYLYVCMLVFFDR